MANFQASKKLVMDYYNELDCASIEAVADVLDAYTADDYLWRGLHPFHEIQGAHAVAQEFWKPLRESFSPLQRRQDIFLAGLNGAPESAQAGSEWVCSMGHLLGLFDRPWLDIPPTGRIGYLRYAEFHRVENGKIAESAFFFDLLSVMKQAGQYPLPQETGHSFMYPGPRTHDGLLFDHQPPAEGLKTLDVIDRMIEELTALNISGENRCPPQLLEKSWGSDMLWYGPTGIGASYTIERYQKQHQYPFREGLSDKIFNGHVCRMAEGEYGCFFGWPNLSNVPCGGFLGLTGAGSKGDMRVVDVYRREGDKLAENWVFIDLPHYLNMQGLDILHRMRQMQIN